MLQTQGAARVKANAGSTPGQWRNSKEASVAGEDGVRTGAAAVGVREGPGDQTAWNLRGQEPDFGFSSELGCLWGTSTLRLA